MIYYQWFIERDDYLKLKKNVKKRILKNIFTILILIFTLLAVFEILKLNILPNKYLTVFLVGEAVLFLLGFLLYNLRKKFFVVLGILLYLISIVGNIFGYYYLKQTNQYIDKTFAKETYTVKTHYYLITGSTNTITDKSELEKTTIIQYNKDSEGITPAMEQLGDFQYQALGYGDYTFYAFVSVEQDNGYFLLPSVEFDFLIGSSNELTADMFKVLYEFDVEEEFEVKDDTPDAFNVYITGYDYTGKARDYNLIATVNLKTHKIVLTSVPRDYYINIPAYNAKDSFKALGVVNSDVPKDALEELFDIKIDYTINVYTESLVKVVDTLGGVEFCSDYDFTTIHDTTLGSYDDKGEKVHVSKGCHIYDGLEILAIARERMHVEGYERGRQANCRQILRNIIKKLASTSSIINYAKLLDSFDGLYTTDINKHMITEFIKEFIDHPDFEIIEQGVDGRDGHAKNHWNTGDIYTLDPYMDTVEAASKKIKEVLNEK